MNEQNYDGTQEFSRIHSPSIPNEKILQIRHTGSKYNSHSSNNSVSQNNSRSSNNNNYFYPINHNKHVTPQRQEYFNKSKKLGPNNPPR